MTSLARTAALAAALVLPLAASACKKPEPPTLTPEQGKITSLSTEGIGLTARFDAYNPNDLELAAKAVQAHVVLDGKVDLGTLRVPTGVRLPAKKHTTIDVPLSVKWSDLGALARLALEPRAIPFTIDGSVELGGDSFSVNVPYTIKGTITHEQLVSAARSSLPKIPGLPQIPGLP
jgi:LEA14-like dessication related protein